MSLSDDIKKINAEINKLRKEMGDEPLKPFKQEDLEAAKLALAGINAEIREMNSDLDYVSKSFKQSVNELSRQNTFLTDARNSLNGIASISDKVLQYRKGEISLSEKQLKNLQQQAKAKFDSLQNDVNSGELKGKNLQEAQDALNKQELFNKELKLTSDIQKQVNKDIGLLGTGIGGVSQLLSKMGFGDMSQPLQDAVDKTKNAQVQQKLNNNAIAEGKEKYKENAEELKKLSGLGRPLNDNEKQRKKFLQDSNKELKGSEKSLISQNKVLGSQTSIHKNIGNALQGQLTKANLLTYAFTALIEGFINSQKGIGDLAKGLGMSATRAADMRQEFANIANLSMDSNVNVKNLQEAQMAVGAALGTNAMLNEEDLITMAEIVKKTGLQYSELVGIQKLSLATGKSLDDNVEAALGGATAYAMQNKMVIDNNKVLREINTASDALKLSLGGSVEALGEAVVKVQQLGMDLKTAEQIASSMLNFESSIEAELEAELLTGKNLNMERARQLALEGDIAGAAKEVADQLGNAEEFGKMNVIQQEALAKSVGMNRDQLAGMLIERQALEAMNAREGQSARERYDELVKEGHTRDEIQKMVGKDAMAQLEQQSAQEKFNASVEKLKEIFTQVMDALAPIFDVLSSIATVVMPAINLILSPLIAGFQLIGDIVSYISSGISSFSEWLSKGSAAATALKVILYPIIGIVAAIAAFMVYASLSAIPVVGPFLAPIAVAGMISIIAKAVIGGKSKANDGIFPAAGGSGYGKRTLLGPEGAIQLNNKDTVIAGTNLFGDDVKSEPGKATEMVGEGEMKATTSPSTTPKVDMSQTNALLQQLISAVTTGGVVTLDGQKVGEALKIGSFQTQ
jgi:hypothetical protein